METIGQIIGIFFAGFLLLLAYKLYAKDRIPSAVLVVWASVFIFLCSWPWFQGWAKSFFASTITTQLKELGRQVNTVQETTTEMHKQLEKHQSEIDNHQKQLNGIQLNIKSDQTNLDAEERRLSDVEYWVKNIYEKVTDEDFAASDTNHVLVGNVRMDNTTNQEVYLIRLSHVPITNSVESYVKSKPLEIEQRMYMVKWGLNIFEAPMEGFNPTNTSLSFHYVIDTRETNFFKDMSEFKNHILVTNGGVFLTHPK
jgi:hypothetical protein